MEVTIEKIGKNVGGKRKKWSSAARVMLEAEPPADGADTPRCVVDLMANRNTKLITSRIITDESPYDVGDQLAEKQVVKIDITRIDTEYLRVKINERSFKAACKVDIRHVRFIATGLSASIQNFVLRGPVK